jgi:hypothetical protein
MITARVLLIEMTVVDWIIPAHLQGKAFTAIMKHAKHVCVISLLRCAAPLSF